MNYLLNISYDGSKFNGYQRQKNVKTVQGEVEQVLSKILNKDITIVSSSRTDAKVHAYNQYANFNEEKEIDPNKFLNSFNKLIDKSIYLKSIKVVDDNFSSRYNVKMKEYIYKINVGKYNPLEKDYVYQYNKNIDIRLLKKASKKILGNHNFRSFTSDKEKSNYERCIEKIKIIKQDDYVYIFFRAKSFLRYMIRNIVGLFIEINEGKKQLEDIDRIFKEEDRTSLGITINPEGLYLNNVWF